MKNPTPFELAAACLATIAFDHRADLDEYTTEEMYGRFSVSPDDAEAFALATNQPIPKLAHDVAVEFEIQVGDEWITVMVDKVNNRIESAMSPDIVMWSLKFLIVEHLNREADERRATHPEHPTLQ